MERVVIVGAGTFGASLAWWLAGRGDEVVLVDQFEPGDRRATSGGETRLIRCAHGAEADYAAMARRARTLWKRAGARVRRRAAEETGVCWFAHREDGWEAESERTLKALDIPTERWSVERGGEALPAFRRQRPGVGAARARGGRAARAEGRADADRAGAGPRRAARPGPARPRGRARRRSNGTVLEGDRVVWSCGGWLRRALPRTGQAAGHPAGAVLLRRRRRLARRARLGRLRPRDVRHRRPRRARREDRLGPARARRSTPTPTCRPRPPRPSS